MTSRLASPGEFDYSCGVLRPRPSDLAVALFVLVSLGAGPGCAGARTTSTESTTPPAAAPASARDPALDPVVGDLAVDVDLAPAAAYRAFTVEIGQWWDHHFSESPYLLRLDARPGGAFVEFFDAAGNGAEHARVILAREGEMLRMVGPLGLSGRAVEFVHTFTFAAREGGGTTVSLHLEVIGALGPETRAIVLQVWEHFLAAFREHAARRGSKAGAPAAYAQPPLADEAKVGLGFYSHLTRGAARNHVHADDFSLEADANLVGVQFWGHVEGRRAGDLDNISDFSLRIHAATPEGAPGAVLREQLFTLADTKPTPTGRRGKGVAGGKIEVIEVGHEVRLSSPLPLRAGATYFLSIAAVRKDGAGEPWMWSDGELRNGRSYSHPLGDPAWMAIDDTDSAFALIFGE